MNLHTERKNYVKQTHNAEAVSVRPQHWRPACTCLSCCSSY